MIDWDGIAAEVAAALRGRGIESDLSDDALLGYANAAREEIAERGSGPLTGHVIHASGWGQSLIELRPPASAVTAVSINGDVVDEATYRLRPGGHFLERLSSGYLSVWSGNVEVTLDAAVQGDRYDRVVVDLVKLALQYSGLDSQRDGDYGEEAKGARGGGGQLNYQLERDNIISELVPAGVGFA